MKDPLVSVVIPTYKRTEELKKAVKSAINQTYKNVEIIVVDDDPNSDLKNLFKKQKVKYIKNEGVKGGSAARNTGIKIAKGKYIAFLDDDDEFLPKKIEKQVAVMESLSSEWFGCYSWRFNAKGKIVKCYKEGDLTVEVLSYDFSFNFGGCSALLIRKKVLDDIGGFDESFRRNQDYELLLRLFKVGKINLIKEPLFIKKGFNMTFGKEKIKNEEFFLSKFKDLIQLQNKKNIKKIYAKHWLVISSNYLEEGEFKNEIKYFIKSFIYYPFCIFEQIVILTYIKSIKNFIINLKKDKN